MEEAAAGRDERAVRGGAEAEWGVGAPIEKITHQIGLAELVVVTALVDLAAVGVLTWAPVERMAFYEPGSPVLGTTE